MAALAPIIAQTKALEILARKQGQLRGGGGAAAAERAIEVVKFEAGPTENEVSIQPGTEGSVIVDVAGKEGVVKGRLETALEAINTANGIATAQLPQGAR